MPKPIDIRRITELVERKLVDDGKLIEAGWQAMRIYFIPKDTSPEQLAIMRMAYYAGAQHLWSAMMGGGLDPGQEPTDADMRRMDNINAELEAWYHQMARRERGPEH